MPDDRAAGRRSYDRDIDPLIETYVEKRLTEERHNLRGEMTVAMHAIEKTLVEMQKQQVAASLTATKEHADVRADIAALMHRVEPVPVLVEKVDLLEQHDTVGTTRLEDRDKVVIALRWWATLVIGALGTCTGLILAFNH